ncbi:nucleotidyl transferase AbiEii/AbiGii toxin family protein [Porphyromonas sp.]|uniref:nucleotidyl transferase AbiEii/AbiGii toxin family protein n=1 Tax=Porphyromonas sp. TaxID=1924944 RepID=UPI0026DADC8D|nr:nucleotidyl transferase AbiEii/AbiGii toxin family protein [Porphyromonas sp.]MDO4771903.1 nucleotidyl transferase AbiEii/AbiGii toxin family protein [Porphyromonas sp.]
MNFQISSEKIGNPLLVALLRKVSCCFAEIEQDFFVIGATARDILIRQLVGVSSGRKTRDLDLAIAISNWDAFEEVKQVLLAYGFEKDKQIYQRFYYDDYEMDIVPYGDVAREDGCIYWPPEEDIAMSVKGFTDVLSDAITVNIDKEFDIKIASLHGLFVLKFNAWLDRNIQTNKDAVDMAFILENYFLANLKRDLHPEVYDWEDFDEIVVGAYWLAYDIVGFLSKEHLFHYNQCLRKEIEKEENSKLLQQIIDSSSSFPYEKILLAFQKMIQVFDKGLCDENPN